MKSNNPIKHSALSGRKRQAAEKSPNGIKYFGYSLSHSSMCFPIHSASILISHLHITSKPSRVFTGSELLEHFHGSFYGLLSGPIYLSELSLRLLPNMHSNDGGFRR